MVTLYIYDIEAKDKKRYTRTKRKFYYHLTKLKSKIKFTFLSKSCIIAEDERILDNFFNSFNREVICFKVKTNNIIKI